MSHFRKLVRNRNKPVNSTKKRYDHKRQTLTTRFQQTDSTTHLIRSISLFAVRPGKISVANHVNQTITHGDKEKHLVSLVPVLHPYHKVHHQNRPEYREIEDGEQGACKAQKNSLHAVFPAIHLNSNDLPKSELRHTTNEGSIFGGVTCRKLGRIVIIYFLVHKPAKQNSTSGDKKPNKRLRRYKAKVYVIK